MNKIDSLMSFQLRKDLPEFGPGDTLAVQVKVIEGDKERLQTFEGIVIQKKGSGIQETFTVRKISNGIGVERIFLKHSPRIAQIEVLKKGRVRRAKLYYLRGRKGKHARVAEKVEIPTSENQTGTDTPSAE